MSESTEEQKRIEADELAAMDNRQVIQELNKGESDSIELSEDDNIIYQLETLASYEAIDLDHPEFDVAYQDTSGNEGFATVCCVDLAVKALQLIRELQAELNLSDEIHHDELIDIQTTVNNTSKRLS